MAVPRAYTPIASRYHDDVDSLPHRRHHHSHHREPREHPIAMIPRPPSGGDRVSAATAAEVHAEMLKADEDLARRLAAEEQERQDAMLAQQMQREEQLRAHRRARSSGPPGAADRHRRGVQGAMGMGMPAGMPVGMGGFPFPMGLMQAMAGGAPAPQAVPRQPRPNGSGNAELDPQRMQRASALFNMLAGLQGLGGAVNGGPMVVRLMPGGGGGVGGVGRARGGDALREDQFQQLLHHLFMQQQQNANRPVGASQTVINAASNVFEVNVARLAPDSRTCSICQCEFENGEQARSLPCFHIFHKECVDRWLGTNKTCPVCRADIEGRPAGDAQPHRQQQHQHQHQHQQQHRPQPRNR